MREILFRGKRTDGDEWVYGFYVCLNGRVHRIYTGEAETDCVYPYWYAVNPETVGQYTGLKDRNGKRIFEGDIVAFNNRGHRDVVKYGEFNCSCCDGIYGFTSGDADIREHYKLEVIGNIYDNPELMEVKR